MKNTGTLPRVVIVGAGFGGLRAARALAKSPVKVTLVDRNNYHLFQPLLYQVATASLSPDEIAQPVRAILGRQRNLDFRMAEARGIDLDARVLDTSYGPIPYDMLVLAAGGMTNTFGLELVARNGLGMKDIGDAEAIRNHILRLIEEAIDEYNPARLRAMLTFVVAGGGPTGVESAGAIAELVHNVLPRDYPGEHLNQARVVLLEAAGRLLPAMPESLADHTLRTLERKDVEVRFGAAVSGFDGRAVQLKDGEEIPARTLIWAAGIQAAGLVSALPLEKGSLGRVKVLPTLQAPDQAGGIRYWRRGLPAGRGRAPAADGGPGGDAAGRACGAQHHPHPARGGPETFRYRDPGTMATIGRSQAVAHIGPVKLHGLIAWLAWVAVHIYQLVGFRNRLAVMMDWAWNYFVYDRPVRMLDARERRGTPEPPPLVVK